jgi:hypothetical protein
MLLEHLERGPVIGVLAEAFPMQVLGRCGHGVSGLGLGFGPGLPLAHRKFAAVT